MRESRDMGRSPFNGEDGQVEALPDGLVEHLAEAEALGIVHQAVQAPVVHRGPESARRPAIS